MKVKSHIWIPLIMLVYLGCMSYMYKDDLLTAGRYFQFYGTIGIELVVITLLYFFLKRRNRLRAERKERERNLPPRN